eukprot:3293166-Pyramimonas_sp.AAC.1
METEDNNAFAGPQASARGNRAARTQPRTINVFLMGAPSWTGPGFDIGILNNGKVFKSLLYRARLFIMQTGLSTSIGNIQQI